MVAIGGRFGNRFIKWLKAGLWQWIFLVLVSTAIWYLAANVSANLEKQHIASGFDFLSRPAGFDLIFHLPPFDETSTYGDALKVAFINTILVSLSGCLMATILGFLIGLGQLNRHPLIALACRSYVELFRNLPLLLQLFFWYFTVLRALPHPRESWSIGSWVFLNIRGLYVAKPLGDSLSAILCSVGLLGFLVLLLRPKGSNGNQFLTHHRKKFLIFTAALGLGGILRLSWEIPELRGFNFSGGMVIIPEFAALLIGLSTYTASFIAEIVRSGISSVARGQKEAALALGLSERDVMKSVVLPQAMRLMVPPLTSQFLNLTKNSSLGAAIAYPEMALVFTGMVLNHTGQAIEVVLMTMLIYLALSLVISWSMNRYNQRISRHIVARTGAMSWVKARARTLEKAGKAP